MLVLSRREKESIRFPELDVTIEILQVKGAKARVGIDAPVEISVLRGELDEEPGRRTTKKILVSEQSEHDLRNQLNSLAISMAFAKRLVATGDLNLAADKLDEAISSIGRCQLGDRPIVSTLVVEDMSNEREMLAGFLRLHGYKVESVSDGLAALDFLENNSRPDVILMDISMPRLDGKSAIQRIRENPSYDDIEIFAISGKTAESAEIDTTENRIAKWFQKPLKPSSLVDAINRHIDSPLQFNN